MKKSIMISLLIAFITPFLSSVSLAILTPAVDGHYTYWEYVCCDNFDGDSYVNSGIRVAPYYSSNYIWCGPFCDEGYSESLTNGIVEFNISSVEGLFTSGRIQAYLYLTVKDFWLHGEKCFFIYGVHDENENGIIEVNDGAYEYLGDACIDLQVGDTISFDVTSAVEHDLFGPDQTSFSGFVIKISSDSSDYPDDYMEFYDHTDIVNAPRLSISEIDSDSDGIPDYSDNCPNIPNQDQSDRYPPQGNGIGDACDCETDFDCSGGVDASDVTTFLADFGRGAYFNPCTNEEPCNGDASCDGDVDALDVNKFLEDFGRSQFNNPCPACTVGAWCVYE